MLGSIGVVFLRKHLLCVAYEFFVILKGDMMDQFQHVFVGSFVARFMAL